MPNEFADVKQKSHMYVNRNIFSYGMGVIQHLFKKRALSVLGFNFRVTYRADYWMYRVTDGPGLKHVNPCLFSVSALHNYFYLHPL